MLAEGVAAAVAAYHLVATMHADARAAALFAEIADAPVMAEGFAVAVPALVAAFAVHAEAMAAAFFALVLELAVGAIPLLRIGTGVLAYFAVVPIATMHANAASPALDALVFVLSVCFTEILVYTWLLGGFVKLFGAHLLPFPIGVSKILRCAALFGRFLIRFGVDDFFGRRAFRCGGGRRRCERVEKGRGFGQDCGLKHRELLVFCACRLFIEISASSRIQFHYSCKKN